MGDSKLIHVDHFAMGKQQLCQTICRICWETKHSDLPFLVIKYESTHIYMCVHIHIRIHIHIHLHLHLHIHIIHMHIHIIHMHIHSWEIPNSTKDSKLKKKQLCEIMDVPAMHAMFHFQA